MKKLVVILVVVIISLAFFLYFFGFKTTEVKRTVVTVARVIDGDTFKLANGKDIRLLGIDAPERKQYFHGESKKKLEELILGKEIILENDVNNKDGLNRLLRYIFVDNVFVNLEMVRQGFANVYIVYPDVKYEKELMQAENEAREKGLGIWKTSSLPYVDCIEISNFHYNAKENDNENLNDEYIVFKNSCDFSIDLTGWTIKDRSANFFTFPEFGLESEKEVVLKSGSGKNTKKELYWNSKRAIWDNKGDTLYLRDREGNLILIHSYGGY